MERLFPLTEEDWPDFSLRERCEIDAAAERGTLCANHDDAHRVLKREVVEDHMKVAHPRLVGAIQDARSIEGDSGDRPVDV